MKKILLILLFIPFATFAQDFAFEDPDVPTEWVAGSGGTLSINTEHYKEGVQSVRWVCSGNAQINISFTSFIASTGNAAYFQVYAPAITNDTLQVEFLNGVLVKRKARFVCNFKGWREFNRLYTEYPSTLSSSITSVRFTLKACSSGNRTLYFDQVNFNATAESGHLIGSPWVADASQFTANNALLNLFSYPIDLAVTTPGSQEIIDLNSLRTTLKRTPAAGTSSALTAAKNYAISLNIVRNADGSVRGTPVSTTTTSLTSTFMSDITSKLEVLAAAALTDATTMTLFQNLLDHLLEQGIAEGCNFQIISSDYTNSRNIPSRLLNILPACTTAEKAEVVKLARWISFYGMLYLPQNSYKSSLVSDVIYLYLPHMAGIALNQPDDASSVRELKALKRFIERCTEYVPGGDDILKPDGTGFHHSTHYNNYMYAYRTWVEYMNYLKGTQFRVSADAYSRMKKAIISIYCMATLDAGDSRHYANALCGRNPFESGIQLQFSKDLFDKLIAVGADCLGTPDTELMAAYNYFFQTTKYNVTAQSYDGFYQFNYSPLGIFRKNNWVATMHAPTTNLWGAEIYNNANRFGRYQSHGALEITYSGTPANSGYPSNGTGGGWDWNIIPGTTTVHYTSWQDMMPYASETGRFDQKTKTKNFSGALSWGDCGMFACDFDQIDTWSSSAFTATNLVFKKSMFAFDNLIIGLGSNIGSSGSYSNTMTTATNLFQNILSASSGNLIVNGVNCTLPYSSTLSATQDNWLVTPQGTGYFIPKGNDAVTVILNNQTTPDETGADYAAPLTTAQAAKAYINHGIKPSGKSYSFVVVPATNSLQMLSLANQMGNGGGTVFQIQAQSNLVHAVKYLPSNITAYSFWGAASNLSFGIVKASSAENLLMEKTDAINNRHYFAICNPNLHPQTDATYGWIATPSQTTLTLAGEWEPINNVAGVSFATPSNGETLVTITMQEGTPLYFGIKAPNDTTDVKNPSSTEWVNAQWKNDKLLITFASPDNSDATITLLSADGKIIKELTTKQQKELQLSPGKLPHGIFLCNISHGNQHVTLKLKK